MFLPGTGILIHPGGGHGLPGTIGTITDIIITITHIGMGIITILHITEILNLITGTDPEALLLPRSNTTEQAESIQKPMS